MLSGSPDPSRGDICCAMTSVVVKLMRAHGAEKAVSALLHRAGAAHDAEYLEHPDNWVSYEQAVALLRAGGEETKDPCFARRVGEQAVAQHFGTQVAALLRSLGSPEAVLSSITLTAAKFSSSSTVLEAVDVHSGRAVVRAQARPGFRRDPLLCDWTKGLLSQPTVLFGLPAAQVQELECQAQGGRECRYVVTWDAGMAAVAADPEHRVSAMEAQLLASSEQLRGVYAMVGDLLSAEEVDTLLERIVARAAGAVRAPHYVLAVSLQAESEPRIYAHGVGRRQAREIAIRADDATAGRDPSLLITEVTSDRGHYGRLIASNPGGTAFFDQEQELLRLYARCAAAVLDMATARQEADRRHVLAAALLELAQTLAQAGTSSEVAVRLAKAVPRVVDCDQFGVHLWDEEERCLSLAASQGLSRDQVELLAEAQLSSAQTPNLQRMLGDHLPQFFMADTAEGHVGAFMRHLGAVAFVAVPIVARERFLGVLSMGVVKHPNRLRETGPLLEQLTGVAAIAAPTLQNGRLVDELQYLATHDSLTGLCNRAAFAERFEGDLRDARGAERILGLLFVDLDGFKVINDSFGHLVGDELLFQSGRRIAGCVRDVDTVARVGGDEFAVVLRSITSLDEIHRAAARIRAALLEPFRLAAVTVTTSASVGNAVWPADGSAVDSLIRSADADMYREKATRGRLAGPRGRPGRGPRQAASAV